jgi:hypothetical protein
MVVELRERLLAWERELNEREDALVVREHDVVAAEHALGRACMECNAEHDRVKTVQQVYWARMHASTTGQQRSLRFDQVLGGRLIVG